MSVQAEQVERILKSKLFLLIFSANKW